MRTNRILNIISINANGLRTKIKRDLLGKLLLDLQVGVGLITETHLRTADLSWIKYPQYHVVSDYCRPVPAGKQIGGGVPILVHQDFTTTKVPKDPKLLPVFEHCSTMLYPTHSTETAIRLKAIYLPPKKASKIKLGLLRRLNRTEGDPNGADPAPRILGGDLNTTPSNTGNFTRSAFVRRTRLKGQT